MIIIIIKKKVRFQNFYKLSFINYRNFAYNILKYLKDKIIENIKIQELKY